MPALRQTAWASVANDVTRTCLVTFDQPTQVGSLIVVIASAIHDQDEDTQVYGPYGFTQAYLRVQDRITVGVWYAQAAPSISTVGVATQGDDTLQVRAIEFTGVAQANALDKVALVGGGGYYPWSGATGTSSQADEVVIGLIANRHQSSTQSGFVGGLTRISDNTSVGSWGPGGRNVIEDGRRSRLTVHQSMQAVAQSWSLGATLTGPRDWVAAVLTFRGGTSGPARMTSKSQPPIIKVGGGGSLTVFGPLKSLNAPPLIKIGGGGRIGPSELQLRLGGWTGLLIGRGTDYRVESVEGLGGWDVRTSDVDFPHGDGAQRGIDLQAARQIVIKLNFNHASPAVLEQMTVDLLAALTPQRSADWDLLFRLPGRPLQIARVRPIQLARELSLEQMILRQQAVALRAADPRLYSARPRTLVVPPTPSTAAVVTTVSAVNSGNTRAYPTITIDNNSTKTLSLVQLINATGDVAFEVAGPILPGSQIVGDMPARVTAAPRSVVTLDGQPRYGAWQAPRQPFFLAGTVESPGGVNALYALTTPDTSGVQIAVQYSDTWAG